MALSRIVRSHAAKAHRELGHERSLAHALNSKEDDVVARQGGVV